MSTATAENPFAGQGSVLLDIGGDVGALVVEMPDEMEGVEVEIRPAGPTRVLPSHGHDHDGDTHDGHGHTHDGHAHDGQGHHPHVAVVRRPVADGHVASLVFGEVLEGSYVLVLKDTDDVRLGAEVRGGEVTQTSWPR